MSIVSPRYFFDMAEHSICHPGLPIPHGDSHAISLSSFLAFHKAKSKGSSFFSSTAILAPEIRSSIFFPESFPYPLNFLAL